MSLLLTDTLYIHIVFTWQSHLSRPIQFGLLLNFPGYSSLRLLYHQKEQPTSLFSNTGVEGMHACACIAKGQFQMSHLRHCPPCFQRQSLTGLELSKKYLLSVLIYLIICPYLRDLVEIISLFIAQCLHLTLLPISQPSQAIMFINSSNYPFRNGPRKKIVRLQKTHGALQHPMLRLVDSGLQDLERYSQRYYCQEEGQDF